MNAVKATRKLIHDLCELRNQFGINDGFKVFRQVKEEATLGSVNNHKS